MRILVCGGRDYGRKGNLLEYKYIHERLNEIVTGHSIHYNPNDNWLPTDIVIIEGGATGADSAAADFATVNHCQHEQYPADWNLYGKRAGYIRNKQMLDEGKPDLVVAFPGGKGTAMMIDLAIKAGVKVIKIGTKGFSTQTEPSTKFKTSKYEKLYCDLMWNTGGFRTPIQRIGILYDMLKEEQAWLDSLGSEYEEIIASQSAMDQTDGS